jgi:riboflavin kinase, archaea type
MRVLKGKVVSDVGNFSFWIEKLQDHYRYKTGMQLFSGTLNIQLDEPFDLPQARTRLEAAEYGGTVSVNIVPCKVFGLAAVILRTDKADSEPQSRKLIEVACEVKLRDQHQLRDGDVIEVEVADR